MHSREPAIEKGSTVLTSWNEHHVINTVLRNQRGSTLLMSVIVLVAVAMTGLSVVKITSAQQTTSAYDLSAQRAAYLAQAGLEHAANQIYHGDDPTLNNAPFLGGALTVSMNSSTGTLTAKGQYGKSTKTYKHDGEFAADCLSIDFGPSVYTPNIGAGNWSHLDQIDIKKTCSTIDTVKVKEVRLLYSTPNFTKLVKHIGINDDSVLYHVPSALAPGYPDLEEVGTPDTGAQSKQVIDVSNYAFNNNGLRKMDIWWNTSFTGAAVPLQIEIDFVDGSVYTSVVKTLP